MVQVTVLPPQETPKQPTAHRRPKDLEEHLMAFLNANNKEGYVADQKITPITLMAVPEIMALEDATLADLLVLLNEHEYVTHTDYKLFVRKMQDSVNRGTGRKTLKFCRALQMLARLFGYKTHQALCALRDLHPNGMIRNFRYQHNANDKVFEQTPKGKYRGMPEVREAFKQARK